MKICARKQVRLRAKINGSFSMSKKILQKFNKNISKTLDKTIFMCYYIDTKNKGEQKKWITK